MEDLQKMILEQMASDNPEEGPAPDNNPLLQNVPDEDAPDEVIWAWVDSLKPNIVLLEPGTFGKSSAFIAAASGGLKGGWGTVPDTTQKSISTFPCPAHRLWHALQSCGVQSASATCAPCAM